jgi:excinuclease ABC subunit A
MSIEEAEQFFTAIPAIHRHLKTLVDVGLGYVRLGQPAPTLSGGEAQRVKLASELQKRSTGRTVYVLDEPTTGLHFEDIRKLLAVLHSLVDKGNTVIVIEHNLDVIKTADWIIDMGPEGGHKGGLLIATGTPEEIAEVADSATGEFLRPIFGITPVTSEGAAVARARKANGTRTNGTKAAPAKATSAKVAPARAAPAKAPAAKAVPARTAAAKAAATESNGAGANGTKTAGTKAAPVKRATKRTGAAAQS